MTSKLLLTFPDIKPCIEKKIYSKPNENNKINH